MPVDHESSVTVSCDNPNCPGNKLDPHDLTGWLLVSHEVYGDSAAQHVFCCNACLSATAGDTTTDSLF